MASKRNRNSNRSASDKRQSKKSAVLEGKKSPMPLIITLILAAAMAGAGVYMLGGKGKTGPVATTAVAATSSDILTFSAGDFADGKAKYYKYTAANGLQIRYFILKSSDGVIRAAFDACDVCWQARKGYRQEGDVMVCNNCGQRFPSVKVNVIKGGCNPAPLNRTLDGDRLIIKIADLLEGGNLYFNFARGGRG